jgi:hypothetical protein
MFDKTSVRRQAYNSLSFRSSLAEISATWVISSTNANGNSRESAQPSWSCTVLEGSASRTHFSTWPSGPITPYPTSGRKTSSPTFGWAPHSRCTCPTSVRFHESRTWGSRRRLITLHVIASEHVKIALHAPSAGPGQATGWYAEGNVGLYQFGSLPNGNYLPLFELQMIRKRNRRPRRDGRDPNEIM